MVILLCEYCGVAFEYENFRKKYCDSCRKEKHKNNSNGIIECFALMNDPKRKINPLWIMTKREIIQHIKDGNIASGTLIERQDSVIFIYDGRKLVPNGIHQMELEI